MKTLVGKYYNINGFVAIYNFANLEKSSDTNCILIVIKLGP